MNKSIAAAVILAVFLPLFSFAEEKEQQKPSRPSFLDFKPHELLPSYTKSESSKIKIVLEPCKDKNLLSAVSPSKEYHLEVGLKVDKDGQFEGADSLIWSRDAIHEIREKISFAGYEFIPNKDRVLVFQVVPEKGYVFTDGVGKVVGPDKKEIELNAEKKGLVIGGPAVKEDAKAGTGPGGAGGASAGMSDPPKVDPLIENFKKANSIQPPTKPAEGPKGSPSTPNRPASEGVVVFGRLEAVALRAQPTDDAPFTGPVITFNNKLLTIKRWREWVLVSLPTGKGAAEGWIKMWHIVSAPIEQDKVLPDLRRILIEQDAKGQIVVTVGGDVYAYLPISLSMNEGRVQATLEGKHNIFMSEYQHYFFDIHAKDLAPLFLEPNQKFTPENLTVYEIRDAKPVRAGAVEDWSSLLAQIPEDDKAFSGPTRGISLNWHNAIIGLDQGYGFLWVEQACLGEWTDSGWREVPETTVKFGCKLLNTASLPEYMKVVDPKSRKTGWIRSVLIGSEDRIDLLKSKGITPKSLMCVVKDEASREYLYVSALGKSAQEGKRTWTPQIGECVLLPSQESIESLKKDGRLPKGLADSQANHVYFLNKEGNFVLLP